jgi:hypothetical protein
MFVMCSHQGVVMEFETASSSEPIVFPCQFSGPGQCPCALPCQKMAFAAVVPPRLKADCLPSMYPAEIGFLLEYTQD